MLETFLSTFQDVFNTISMLIQYFIHAIQHLVFFLVSLGKAVQYIYESFTFLPLFFAPITSVVLAIMIIRAILSKE